uniref:peptidylprolyl isomerase n=1 Tax=Chromera velia CCMP2878 TaxID=1169474 RepID=A0A0G4HTK3_9ALVE|eukprot:Cvel_1343.t1-p1 / transcript=Cvel_1343.t1 / gene=Cvel_1343 / organism=Chromera_velia_CCMP2878 / gene_product=FK506-binding protein 1, putative / transcript_product=FK506-binding protein 1, putative / location=Cvel_scaffold46:48854-49343(-) / protein_length=115 / sequence_SO=supercontig / SO=protein_coding / is_pseudo=false
MQTTGSGIQYQVTKQGDGGAKPPKGTKVKAHYTGWLKGFNDGPAFDSSRTKGRFFEFQAGVGQVIPGWDEMICDMTKGEARNIILPPNMAYGSRGAGGVIPPNATLYFEMELVDF